MANVTITQLPVAGPIVGTELVPIVQDGQTRQTTTAAIAASPSQLQTFLTLNQEPTLPNSRRLSVQTGLGLTDGGALSTLALSLNGASGALETALTGIVAKTGSTTVVARTLTASGLGLSITDGSGVAGNPTFALTGQVAGIANLTGPGMVSVGGGSVNARVLLGTADQISVSNGDGSGSPTFSLASNPVIPGVGAMIPPKGTTAERPGGTAGQFRYNTDLATFEGFATGTWVQFPTTGSVTTFSAGTTGFTPSVATGGAITLAGTLSVANGGTGQTTYTDGQILIGNTTGNTLTKSTLTAGSGISITNGSGSITIAATGGAGTVTSVGQTFTGGLISVSGSPIISSGTLALTVAGTSGGIPYFSSGTTWASSAALAANALVVGGGAGVAPSTVTTGTNVLTALGVNVGTAGAFVVNGGALGTPSSGTLTNATGLPISTGVSGLGTGVATALAVNTGTAGAFVVNGGALGTPSSGTLTNVTGLPLSTGVTGTLGVANGGTGQTTYTDGQLLIGNSTGNTLTKATLTAGAGISITNGSGAITIASTGGSATLTISNKTGAYTVVSGDNGTIINCTSGTFTVSLTAAASLGAGFNCWVWNTSSTATDTITIDPSGAETIDGRTTLILRRGEGTQIVCDGTNWQTGDKKTMRGYAENISSSATRPVASADKAIAIGDTASALQGESVAIGHQSSATGFYNIAIGRANTSGTAAIAFGFETSATATSATAIGGTSASAGSKALGAGSTALGGSYASGTDSFAAAVANNTSTYGAQGANSVAIGRLAIASGTQSIAISSAGATASATGAVAIGGTSGNLGPQATAVQSMAVGSGAVAAVIGKYAYATRLLGVVGDAQYGLSVLRVSTTSNTATPLVTDAAAAGASNQVILPNNSAYAFTGTVVARRQASGGTESAAWKIEGLIRREGNAASTTLVASTVTEISNVPTWTLALSADTTNGGLAITATGAAATNIRWVATVQTSEVAYA